MKHHVPLTEIGAHKKAKVVEVSGGKFAEKKLSDLGIRPGVAIVKISSQMLKGPITVKAGQCTVSIGHGLALKIIVEPQH